MVLEHPSDTLDAVSKSTNSQRRLGDSHVKREIVHLNGELSLPSLALRQLLRSSGTPQFYTPMTMLVEIQDPRASDATAESPKHVGRWKMVTMTGARVNIAWEAACEGAGCVNICISTTQAGE
ncbi:hypothetical protein HYFRA_00001639 [Hymenoscyphus fraxineus]|uniref:Uncharacterized protein n=1 Tax=Hymenoscyphus fraxineus TaxID=746836 RepID=A0A9N9L7Y4_9HELO|nr:hypothetical protein HYFRA_00001639 [Hymenoscyphus fraxineus]